MVHCNTGGLISISFLELITRDRTMRVDRRRSQEDVKTTPCDGDSHSSLHAQLTALSPVLARQRQISCLTVIPLDRIWPVSDSKTNCVIDYTTHKLRLSGVARNSCFFSSQYSTFDTCTHWRPVVTLLFAFCCHIGILFTKLYTINLKVDMK